MKKLEDFNQQQKEMLDKFKEVFDPLVTTFSDPQRYHDQITIMEKAVEEGRYFQFIFQGCVCYLTRHDPLINWCWYIQFPKGDYFNYDEYDLDLPDPYLRTIGELSYMDDSKGIVGGYVARWSGSYLEPGAFLSILKDIRRLTHENDVTLSLPRMERQQIGKEYLIKEMIKYINLVQIGVAIKEKHEFVPQIMNEGDIVQRESLFDRHPDDFWGHKGLMKELKLSNEIDESITKVN